MNRLTAFLLAFLFHIWTTDNTPQQVGSVRVHNVPIERAWEIVIQMHPDKTIMLDKQHWPK